MYRAKHIRSKSYTKISTKPTEAKKEPKSTERVINLSNKAKGILQLYDKKRKTQQSGNRKRRLLKLRGKLHHAFFSQFSPDRFPLPPSPQKKGSHWQSKEKGRTKTTLRGPVKHKNFPPPRISSTPFRLSPLKKSS